MALASAEPKKPAKGCDSPVPIFLENPDGSMAEGIPPGFKDATPPRSPRMQGVGWWDENMALEFEYIYSRHEKLFLSLLLMEFVVELTFNVMYVYYAEYSVREVSLVYHGFELRSLWIIFWVLFGAEIAYCFFYYGLGFMAIYKNRPSYYKYFAHVALLGILGQVLLAYMNKFNLLVFFLRLMAYIYAKFLRNLLQSLFLLPQEP